jgi:hypothetical protein
MMSLRGDLDSKGDATQLENVGVNGVRPDCSRSATMASRFSTSDAGRGENLNRVQRDCMAGMILFT